MLALPPRVQRLLPWVAPYFTSVIAAISAANLELARSWYSHAAYYLLWVLLWIWGLSTANLAVRMGWNPAAWARRHWMGLAASAVLAALVGTAVPATLRILSDEANVIAVSRSMVFEKRADNVTHGYRFFMNFFTEDRARGDVEKHGLLFPFGVHLIHAVTGYRAENAYVFNMLCFLALLVLAYSITAARRGRIWGVTACLLVAAMPIIPLVGRSGGVDLLGALVFLVYLCALRIHTDRRDDASLGFLVSSTALMVHARQEYALPGLLGLAVVWAAGRLDVRAVFTGYLPTRLLALTALPIWWQRLLVKDPFENAAHEAPFALSHFLSNNWIFLKQFWSIQYFIPFSPVILIAGTASLAWACWRFAARRPQVWPPRTADTAAVSWIAIGTALAVEWAILTSYFRGIPDHPSDTRYFVLYCAVLSLAMADGLAGWMRRAPVRALSLALTVFAVFLPVATDGRFINSQLAVRYHAFAIDFLKKNAHQNSLIVSNRPGHFAIYGYGSVSIGWANHERRMVLDFLRQHAVRDIYVIQQLNPKKDMEPVKEDAMHPDFILEPILLMQNTPEEIIRISKVVIDDVNQPGHPSSFGKYRAVTSPFPGLKGVVGIPQFQNSSPSVPPSSRPVAVPSDAKSS
jgi:hypothetical protein